jgi:dihydropyrimidinase
MEALTKEGVNSFKFFLAYKGALAVAAEDLLAGLKRSKELGALPMVRCPAARDSCL